MDKPVYDPKASPLTKEETENAKKELVSTFPKVVRSKVDPRIPHQEYTNISFIFLKEPKDGVYGFFNPRGTWEDADKATEESEKIIQNVDSVNKIHIAPTGYWSPITNNEKYSQDQMDVKTNDKDFALRDRAAKDAARKNQQERRELNEKREELKNLESDIDANPESLDYYTKKKVAQKELNGYLVQANEKIKTLKKSLRKVEKEIKDLSKKHPEYIDQWLENYNKARRRVGLEDIKEKDIEETPTLGHIEE